MKEVVAKENYGEKLKKKSLDYLLHITTVTNERMYNAIHENAYIYKLCDETIPILLRNVPELRMAVNFIIVDLQTIVQACFKTNKTYEKRYHLKNLYAGMLEGYKLLYGFGKMRSHTIWAKIGENILKAIQDNSNDSIIFIDLKEKYDEITHKLLEIESKMTDKDDRNLTYHYDDDLLLVYRLTLKTSSEEKAALMYIEYLNVLNLMLELANQVEFIEAILKNVLPTGVNQSNKIALTLIQEMSNYMAKDPKVLEVLSLIVDKGTKYLDSFADNKKVVVNVEDYIANTITNKTEIPEIGILKKMLDMQMLVWFMTADIATIMRNFISAGSKPEYPLSLKRLTISRVSTLNHLIGYKEDDSDSMWNNIILSIPKENYALLEEGEKIRIELKRIRRKDDLEKRALYVHLIDNRKFFSNVPAILKSMEDITILTELDASKDVIKISKRVSHFLTNLMNVLAEKAKLSRIESGKKLKMQLDKIRVLTNHPNNPATVRDSILKQLDEIENLLHLEQNINKVENLN